MGAFAYCLQVFCGICMVPAGGFCGSLTMYIWLASVHKKEAFQKLAIAIDKAAEMIAADDFGRHGTSMTLIPITICSFLFCVPWCLRTNKSIVLVGWLNAAALLVGVIGFIFNHVKARRADGQVRLIYATHCLFNLSGALVFAFYLIFLSGFLVGRHLRNREKKAADDSIVVPGYAPVPGYGATQPAVQLVPGYAVPGY